jgi:predicted DCC family thiol-disulfide oxidoreductase YuxK
VEDKPIILFDGICNLCNAAVQYVIRHDPAGLFKFASLQSETGQHLLSQYKLGQTDFNSFVLIEGNRAFTKSTAALRIAKNLRGLISILGGFIFVPTFIRDGIYNVIAKHRYQWFGKRESCMMPTPALESRFLK